MVSINLNNKNLWSVGLNLNQSAIKPEIKKEELTLRTDLQIDGFIKSEDNNEIKKSGFVTYKNKRGDTLTFLEPFDKKDKKAIVIVQITTQDGTQVIRNLTWKETQQQIKNGNYKLQK